MKPSMHHSLAIALVIAAAIPAGAQNSTALLDSARAAIDRAVDSGDERLIRESRAALERIAAVDPKNPWVDHYIGYTFYREAVYRAQRDGKPAGALLKQAQSAFERSIALKSFPETQALLAAVIGQSIGSNPFKGMINGPKSDKAMDMAIAQGPDNPRVWLLNGIGTLYKPKTFGGGIDKAKAHLLKAAELYKTDRPAAPAPTWGHAETYAWLGQIALKQHDTTAARQAYARALEIQPGYGWVKLVLLPALDRPAK